MVNISLKKISKGNGVYFYFNLVCLSLFMIVFGILFVGMPKFVDDYWYMMQLKPWFESQGIADPNEGGNIFSAGIPWSELWATCVNHYEIDNCRLGNMTVPFFLMFPKWLGSGIAWLVWIYTLFAGYRLAGVDWRRSALVPLSLLLFWYAMPWADHMGSMVYQFNYVLGLGLCVLLISLLRRRGGRLNPVAGFLLGVVCGAWQEGVSMPLFCGLVSLILFRRESRNSGMIWATVGVLCGIGLLMLSPGIQTRLSLWGGSSHRYDALLGNLWGLAYCFWYAIYLLLLAITWMRGKWKRTAKWQVCFFTTAIGASVFVYISFNMGPRIIMAGNYFAVLAIVGQLRVLLSGRHIAGKRIMIYVANICIMSLLLTSQAYACRTMLHMRRSMLQLYADLSKGDGETIFAETYPVKSFPLVCVTLPDDTYYRDYPGYYRAYLYGNFKQPALIPQELRYVTSESGTELRGDAGGRLVSGHVVVPAENYDSQDCAGYATVDFGKGWTYVPTMVQEFVSEGDGRKYVYVYVDVNFYIRRFKRVAGIKSNKL